MPSWGGNEFDMGAEDAAEARLIRLLNLILEAGVESLGFDAATVTARYGEKLTTVAATDQRLIAMDDAQYVSGEGPCLSVLDGGAPLLLRDAPSEERFELFRQMAGDLGVITTLSVHVPLEGVDGVASSLNLYSHEALDIGDAEVRSAEGFSTQVAAAIESVEEFRSVAGLATGLAEAIRSRAIIEQAKGMLMAEHRIDAQQAFELLRTISQKTNVKLRDVARRLVEERSGAPAQDPGGPDMPHLGR
jgi:GAF domain-containing protein